MGYFSLLQKNGPVTMIPNLAYNRIPNLGCSRCKNRLIYGVAWAARGFVASGRERPRTRPIEVNVNGIDGLEFLQVKTCDT